MKVGVAPGLPRRFTISLKERRRSSLERAPRRSQPSRTQSVSLKGPRAPEVGKLHLFPQPVTDVVDLEFQQELDFALVLAAGSLLSGTRCLDGSKIHRQAWLALARSLASPRGGASRK